MQRTFRLRKHYLHAGLWPGLLFLTMAIACVAAGFVKGPLVGCLAIAAFWLGFVLLSAWILVTYFCEQLHVDGIGVEKRGIFSNRELLLDSSASLKWRLWPRGGSAVVRSPLSRIAIDFDNYDPSERVELIDHLHSVVSVDQQTGWEAFCQRWALPLVEPVDETKTVLLTRRHIDRLFAWMLVPTLGVTALLVWLDGWKWWPSLLVLVPFWVAMRTVVSRSGTRASSTAALPGFGWWLASFVGLVGGMLLYAWMKPVGVAVWVVAAGCFVQFFRWITAEDRRQRKQRAESQKTADSRWRTGLTQRQEG